MDRNENKTHSFFLITLEAHLIKSQRRRVLSNLPLLSFKLLGTRVKKYRVSALGLAHGFICCNLCRQDGDDSVGGAALVELAGSRDGGSKWIR